MTFSVIPSSVGKYQSESDWGCFGAVPSAAVQGRHSKCIIYPFIIVLFVYFSMGAWAPVPWAQWPFQAWYQ